MVWQGRAGSCPQRPTTRAKAVPAAQNLNIKIRFHSLAGSRRDGQAQKTAILNYTHTDGGRRRRYRRFTQMWVFCRPRWMLVVVLAHQAGRAPACPVVPILNTCQQKLSSPTCFKHQTCNYLFTPNTFAAPAFVYFLRRLSGQWEDLALHQESNVPRAPTMFCEL